MYLDAPYLQTDLAAYFEPLGSEAARFPLSGNYGKLEPQDRFLDFALLCGVASQLDISEVTCRNNPHRSTCATRPGTISRPPERTGTL